MEITAFILTLPFAVLSRTSDREAALRRAAVEIDAIADRPSQSNLAMSTAILAGLILEKDLIGRVLRKDLMSDLSVWLMQNADNEVIDG
ncbi:MAG: hypothetical protein AAFZ49_10345 [Cyanobacteria bacterium J06659_2]